MNIENNSQQVHNYLTNSEIYIQRARRMRADYIAGLCSRVISKVLGTLRRGYRGRRRLAHG